MVHAVKGYVPAQDLISSVRAVVDSGELDSSTSLWISSIVKNIYDTRPKMNNPSQHRCPGPSATSTERKPQVVVNAPLNRVSKQTLRRCKYLALKGGAYPYGCTRAKCLHCATFLYSVPMTQCRKVHSGTDSCTTDGWFPHLSKALWAHYHTLPRPRRKWSGVLKEGRHCVRNPLASQLTDLRSLQERNPEVDRHEEVAAPEAGKECTGDAVLPGDPAVSTPVQPHVESGLMDVQVGQDLPTNPVHQSISRKKRKKSPATSSSLSYEDACDVKRRSQAAFNYWLEEKCGGR